jgi:hypothetical protein
MLLAFCFSGGLLVHLDSARDMALCFRVYCIFGVSLDEDYIVFADF